MTDVPPEEARKRQLQANFDALASTYDQLHFLQVCAARLIEHTSLAAGARVLDVATGTGVIALGVAQRVGPNGSVVGVDLSPEMVSLAQKKLAQTGLTNVTFQEGDAEHLDFPDESFDAVLCSSSLFFVPDMLAALREWRRVLVPGGTIGFSSYGPTFLQPTRDLWEARLRLYGLTAISVPTHRLPDTATCQDFLQKAGFTQIDVRSEQLGYYLPSAQERWTDITAGLEGKPVLRLTPAQQEQIQAEHFAELAALTTAQGIWVDVPALLAFGKKAATSEG